MIPLKNRDNDTGSLPYNKLIAIRLVLSRVLPTSTASAALLRRPFTLPPRHQRPQVMNFLRRISAQFCAVLAAHGFALADNVPPELYAPLPADLTLQPGSVPTTITLADHLRDPDVAGTAVRISTRIGTETRNIDLALFDTQAPATVANFLAYVASGRYAANFFHRSVPGFIIQNGGYYFQDDTTFDYVPTYDPVVNEPGVSNTRGTIAMAKLSGDPDSATSQWFINLADNSANLDTQNEGFTVFGRVLGSGMTVVDAVAALRVYDSTPSPFLLPWDELPLSAPTLNRQYFVETSIAVIPALATTVQSSAPDTVAASITNGVLTLTPSATAAGTATITLTTTDLEGGQLVSSFDVTTAGLTQSITLTEAGLLSYGDAITGTSDADLPVTLQIVSGPAVLDDEGRIVATGLGTVVVRATQPGNALYLAAESVQRAFTVAAAPLTARAPNLTRAVSQPNPPLTVAYEGFVGADTPSVLTTLPKLATTAKPSSAPGAYPISITGGSSPLYALTLVPGTLTVVGYGGTYEALLLDADEHPSGKITVTVSDKNLTFTGTLRLAGEAKTIGLKGGLAPSADFSSASASLLLTVAGTAYDLTFAVSTAGTLTGALERDSTLIAELAYGARSTPPAKGQTAPGAGANTLSLSPAHALSEDYAAALPGGAGYATAPIAASTGALTLKGKTADGSPLTASLPPLAQNTYLLWANPYGTRTASFLAGRLALSAHPEQTRFPGRLLLTTETGLLTWQKAALPEDTAIAKRDQSHRAGFGPLGVPVAFDPWLPPSAKATTKAPVIPAGTLAQRLGLVSDADASAILSVLHGPESIDFGASGPDLPYEATLNAKGVVTATDASATAWTIKVTPATGIFSGSFTLRDIVPPATKATARKVTFTGILRQPPSTEEEPRLGAGQFLVPGFAKTDEQPSGEIRLVTAATP